LTREENPIPHRCRLSISQSRADENEAETCRSVPSGFRAVNVIRSESPADIKSPSIGKQRETRSLGEMRHREEAEEDKGGGGRRGGEDRADGPMLDFAV